MNKPGVRLVSAIFDAMIRRMTPKTKDRAARWEWEVERWEEVNAPFVTTTQQRWWTAKATGTDEDVKRCAQLINTCNVSEFCGVQVGCIFAQGADWSRIDDGLTAISMRLCEARSRIDVMKVISDGAVGTHQIYQLTNFYDLMQGEHRIVSIGGKEVA